MWLSLSEGEGKARQEGGQGCMRAQVVSEWLYFICDSCCDKLPASGWPTRADIFLSQVWRPEVQNQGVGRAMLPPKAPGEDPTWPPPASVAPSIQSHVAFPLRLCVSFSVSDKDSLLGLRAHPILT